MFITDILRVAACTAVITSLCTSSEARFGFERDHQRGGAVYTMSNADDGNRILAFKRLPNGSLHFTDSFPTGGFGTGGGLGNQSGLVLTSDGDWLLAVNAASAEVSLFEVQDDVLVLRDIVPSGGLMPLSIAVHQQTVYVLNGGGTAEQPDNITGFRLWEDGGLLIPMENSTRTLSADSVGPAQVGFNPWGSVLAVTEKATNTITTFTVAPDGLPSTGQPQASNGPTPFGFAFDRWGRLIVSEAAGGAPDASTVSSYNVNGGGMLSVITASAPTMQTAACWIALDRFGRHAYTTNTGSGSISGFAVSFSGALTLLDDDGVTASTGPGSAPIDMALTRDGRYIYSLNGGDNPTITGFRVKQDGSLEPVEVLGGIPTGSNGLAAR